MWYYVENREQQGPVDEDAIAELIDRGTINGDTLVWQEGMANWLPAEETKLIIRLQAPTAPPLPAACPEVPAVAPVSPSPYAPESFRTLWLWIAWLLGLGLPLCLIIIGLAPVIAGVVISYILLYRFWCQIQDGTARTTPGKAVGFCFIPFFNLYWVYVAIVGLTQDMNHYCDERGIDVPRANEGLAVAYYVTHLCGMVPYLGTLFSIASMVLFIILFGQIAKMAAAIAEYKS